MYTQALNEWKYQDRTRKKKEAIAKALIISSLSEHIVDSINSYLTTAEIARYIVSVFKPQDSRSFDNIKKKLKDLTLVSCKSFSDYFG